MEDSSKLNTERKRRRRELYIIAALIPVILFFTYLGSHTYIISGDVPISTNILVVALININVILLVLLIFFVLRNVVKIFFESRSRVIGSRLRTRLIASYVGLTIIPTFILFFFVVGFINKSIDAWFDIKIEDALEESLELARNFYTQTSEKTRSSSQFLASTITNDNIIDENAAINSLIDSIRIANDFSTIEVLTSENPRVAFTISDNVTLEMVPYASGEVVTEALGGKSASVIETLAIGDVVRGYSPIYTLDGSTILGGVVVSYYVPRSLMAKMNDILATFQDYQQLKLLKNPVKASYIMILLIITLLLVFFSIWIGRYVAREITVPIKELAEGTHAVASGNLDYKIKATSHDEIGLLVGSFNRMTDDLKAGKQEIEKGNLELRGINAELESRRRYIEIVLGNVPAGVVSIDGEGSIVSINRVGAEMLGTEEITALGRPYQETISVEAGLVLEEIITEMREHSADVIERQARLTVGDKVMTVLINFSALLDEDGKYIGAVGVLDDFTHLLKTQRMFAWKEVARRIAHEIKNPLTPIQLSAQRLRKKYMDNLPDDGRVMDDCTKTIIRQVDELKTLVNEFSSFARMPTANPSPNNLNDIVHETLAFYRAGHGDIEITPSTDPKMPVLEIDRDQIKRVIINLVDNAIAAVSEGGKIMIETSYDAKKKLALLEVSDTGVGITPEDKQRLFEPSFSTKKSGTGLGLAIVSNIVSDHSGYIRVRDNRPRGTVFSIELPIRVVPI